MPQLAINKIVEDLELIDRQLEKEDYDTAQFLLNDLIDRLTKINVKLEALKRREGEWGADAKTWAS